jgi:hypothetical protein
LPWAHNHKSASEPVCPAYPLDFCGTCGPRTVNAVCLFSPTRLSVPISNLDLGNRQFSHTASYVCVGTSRRSDMPRLKVLLSLTGTTANTHLTGLCLSESEATLPSDNSILENLGEIRITVESLWKMLFSSPCPRCRTGSLRTAVSVAGKRIFEGRDKELETARRIKNAVAETKSR